VSLDWEVEAKIGDSEQSLRVTVDQQLLLGRTPNGSAEMPSLDLSNYKASDLGVSRRHGLFIANSDGLSYQDMGSENGSFINGKRLASQEVVKLSSGDVLHLAHLKLVVTFKSRVRKTSIVAIRPNLKLSSVTTIGTGQRIMVVEDETGLAEMYRIGLERNGYSVQLMREVVSAIRALNRYTPSAIVLDLMLPGIRGIELCRYVRRDTECPDIPIIVVSALRDEIVTKEIMDAGADLFMTKPLDWRELVRVISSLIQNNEVINPAMHTKKLSGTAKLDHIPATGRTDTLVIFIDGHREPLTATAQPLVALGRQNASSNGNSSNQIDLEPYGAFEKGVSRNHSVIRRAGVGFEIEDLGSANGTFLNGFSLMPHAPHIIKNGDELRLGELRMHIYFLAETEIAIG
jgi:DNA-binding response OmpR family regulator